MKMPTMSTYGVRSAGARGCCVLSRAACTASERRGVVVSLVCETWSGMGGDSRCPPIRGHRMVSASLRSRQGRKVGRDAPICLNTRPGPRRAVARVKSPSCVSCAREKGVSQFERGGKGGTDDVAHLRVEQLLAMVVRVELGTLGVHCRGRRGAW